LGAGILKKGGNILKLEARKSGCLPFFRACARMRARVRIYNIVWGGYVREGTRRGGAEGFLRFVEAL